MNKNYVKGRNFEYRIIKFLRDRGFYVIRSYGSHGVFDMVAVPPKGSRLTRALLIQAKYSGKGKVQINPEERKRLGEATKRYKGYCCIVTNEGINSGLLWKLLKA